MKALIAVLNVVLFFNVSFAQNIWVADNRPTAPSGPHVFADVSSAISAASPGDIIHVIPSATLYPDFTISKDSLTIYGIGFNPAKDQPNLSQVNGLIVGAGTFGVRVSGMVITGTLQIGDASANSMGNIVIENCEIRQSIDADICCSVTTLSNLVIRNCIMGQNYAVGDNMIQLTGADIQGSSIVLTNNIIMGSTSTSSGGKPALRVNDAIIKNNLFLGNGSSQDYALDISTSSVSNNIFYGRTAMDNPSDAGTIDNSTFNNNLTFGSINNNIPIGINGNTGDSLLRNEDPLFINLPLVDDWSFSYDATPNTGSPALSAGNDGLDVGLTGSTIPFKPTGTPLPIISILRIPEIIKQGDDLDAEIEAVGN